MPIPIESPVSWLLNVPALLAFTSLAVLFSVATRNGIVGVLDPTPASASKPRPPTAAREAERKALQKAEQEAGPAVVQEVNESEQKEKRAPPASAKVEAGRVGT
jgi:hypothetical protein